MSCGATKGWPRSMRCSVTRGATEGEETATLRGVSRGAIDVSFATELEVGLRGVSRCEMGGESRGLTGGWSRGIIKDASRSARELKGVSTLLSNEAEEASRGAAEDESRGVTLASC